MCSLGAALSLEKGQRTGLCCSREHVPESASETIALACSRGYYSLGYHRTPWSKPSHGAGLPGDMYLLRAVPGPSGTQGQLRLQGLPCGPMRVGTAAPTPDPVGGSLPFLFCRCPMGTCSVQNPSLDKTSIQLETSGIHFFFHRSSI